MVKQNPVFLHTKWCHVACFIAKNPSIIYAVLLEAGRLHLRAVTWRHSTKRVFGEPLRGATLRSGYLASRYGMLEAERLLRRAVTIVRVLRDTSATSCLQNVMIQKVCV